MKKIVILLFLTSVSYAQTKKCGTTAFMAEKLKDSHFSKNYYQFQNEFNAAFNSNKTAKNNNSLLVVPVAFHYPTGNESDRECLISLAQEQLNILNNDFNATNSDLNLWFEQAAPFYPGVQPGSLDVYFCLATQNHPLNIDPELLEGQPAVTIGYEFGGTYGVISDINWAGYLNIVVGPCDFAAGYSYIAANPNNGDAVFISNAFIGSGTTCGISPNNFSDSSDFGRVATHEIGHYFNLFHPFADCTCDASSTDFVDDTPQSNCTSGWDPPFGSVPGCNPPEKVLTMDYMDYQPGYAQFLFTEGQMYRSRTRLESIFDQYKIDFGSCSTLNSTQNELQSLLLYPNPSRGIINLKFNTEKFNTTEIVIFNTIGQVVYENNILISNEFAIDISNLPAGHYFMKVKNGEEVYNHKIIKN